MARGATGWPQPGGTLKGMSAALPPSDPEAPRPPWLTWELVGLFWFLVGLAGLLPPGQKALHHHYTLWGLPLVRWEQGFLVVGGLVMLFGASAAPWRRQGLGPGRLALSWLRLALTAGMLGYLVGWLLR